MSDGDAIVQRERDRTERVQRMCINLVADLCRSATLCALCPGNFRMLCACVCQCVLVAVAGRTQRRYMLCICVLHEVVAGGFVGCLFAFSGRLCRLLCARRSACMQSHICIRALGIPHEFVVQATLVVRWQAGWLAGWKSMHPLKARLVSCMACRISESRFIAIVCYGHITTAHGVLLCGV